MQTQQITIAFLTTLLLAGCAPMPPQPKTTTDSERTQAMRPPRARVEASQRTREPTQRPTGAQGRLFLLDAIETALEKGNLDTAETLLAEAESQVLPPRQRLLARLLRAELQLARHQPDRALDTLLALRLPNMPLDLWKRQLRDLAIAYRQMGNLLESANALQQLDTLLEDQEARLRVQTRILESLSALNERTLRELRPSPPGTIGGWMDLALLIKQYSAEPQELARRVREWRLSHPQHPALPELLERLQSRLAGQTEQTEHIAVLLPQTGRYAAAARALRDGLMIGLYDLPQTRRPLLRFYDSSDPTNAWPLYVQAVTAGAQAVIGPLQKEGVRQLLHAGELAVPVLALNKVESDVITPDKLFMFSLDPQQEARLAAERIWQKGMRHPVALVPANAHGTRLERAFRERWRDLTGNDIDSQRYDPASSDHSRPISALLGIDRSKARHARLQRWLGQRIEFEPRRRADVDAIFLVATPRQAQSIKPQLAFFRAADLPVYATSQAWTGHLTPQQLADMRGIRLPDIPLIVNREERQRLGSAVPGVLGPGVRLYAMGIDALRLHPLLRRLLENPWESLDGQTGNLHMTPEHRVERQLLWIELDEPPRILGYSNPMDLDGMGEAAPPTGGVQTSGAAEDAMPSTTNGSDAQSPRVTPEGR